MKIGVIGASLAGLVAGDKLAKAGHDVTVIANTQQTGGRLATLYRDEGFFDYGLPFLTDDSENLPEFFDYLNNKDYLSLWSSEITHYDGSNPYQLNPYTQEIDCYACPEGFSAIIEPLKRWVDISRSKSAGGLTYYGWDRGKKRPWMINLTDFNVFECDAVILATNAVKAYGILQTAQDETVALRLIRELDEIQYEPCITLMASYKHNAPEWNVIKGKNSRLSWICNDSSKCDMKDQTNITLHSSPSFAKNYLDTDKEEIKELLLKKAASIAKAPWIKHPNWVQSHQWKRYKAINPIDDFYMELEMKDAPLALIGDYFRDSSVGAAYSSAVKLADHWIEKYEDTVTVNV